MMTCVSAWRKGLLHGRPYEEGFCANCRKLGECVTDPAWQTRSVGEAREMFPCLRNQGAE